MKSFSLNLRGRRYKVRFVKPDGFTDANPKDYGECDPRKLPNPEIRIRKNQRPRAMLDTCTHEVLHGCAPDLDEQAVTEIANCISRALWKLGYRRCG